jgi:hypothetical protein
MDCFEWRRRLGGCPAGRPRPLLRGGAPLATAGRMPELLKRVHYQTTRDLARYEVRRVSWELQGCVSAAMALHGGKEWSRT